MTLRPDALAGAPCGTPLNQALGLARSTGQALWTSLASGRPWFGAMVPWGATAILLPGASLDLIRSRLRRSTGQHRYRGAEEECRMGQQHEQGQRDADRRFR